MSSFSIGTSAWPTEGAATAGTTTFATVGNNWSHGVDGEGRKYIEHSGLAGTDVVNPIAESLVTTYFNTAGLQTYRFTMDFMVTGGDGSAAASEFNEELFWFSGSILWCRHVTDDNLVRDDGSVSHVRLYIQNGTLRQRNANSIVYIPTDTVLTLSVELQETGAGVFTARYYVNGECIGISESASITNTFAGRIVEPRSLSTGTASSDCKLRLYGTFVGEQAPAPSYPDLSKTSPALRPMPVSLDAATGWWENSGTPTLSGDIDQLNGGTGNPSINAVTQEIAAGAWIRTRSEVGTLPTLGGAGAVVIPAMTIANAGTRVTLDIEGPGTTDPLVSVRFDTDGRVKHASGGLLVYNNVLDQDGQILTWTTGDVYEVAVHFADGKKPSVVLHNRSQTFVSTQTFRAGELTSASTGVPVAVGKIELLVAGTGSIKTPGIWLAAEHWLSGSSSWTHATGSTYGGPSRVLQEAIKQQTGWFGGNEIPGTGAYPDRPPELSAIGRSGADLADWEANNPAWADLLPLLPAARFYWADTMVNHLVAARAGDVVAARDEVLAQVQRFIDAAKINSVKADFMSQWPLPHTVGPTTPPIPESVTQACSYINTEIAKRLRAAGRRDLFTWADVVAGQSESDFYDAVTDDVHYKDAGNRIAFNKSYSERAPIGSAGQTLTRNMARSVLVSTTSTITRPEINPE